jgi:hypothetical protein
MQQLSRSAEKSITRLLVTAYFHENKCDTNTMADEIFIFNVFIAFYISD